MPHTDRAPLANLHLTSLVGRWNTHLRGCDLLFLLAYTWVLVAHALRHVVLASFGRSNRLSGQGALKRPYRIDWVLRNGCWLAGIQLDVQCTIYMEYDVRYLWCGEGRERPFGSLSDVPAIQLLCKLKLGGHGSQYADLMIELNSSFDRYLTGSMLIQYRSGMSKLMVLVYLSVGTVFVVCFL